MAKANSKKTEQPTLLSKEQMIAQAKELSEKLSVKILYSNSKQEFFTDENAGMNSDKKENIVTYDFSKVTNADAAGSATPPVEPPTPPRKITQEDLDANPALAKQGAKVGDDFIEAETPKK